MSSQQTDPEPKVGEVYLGALGFLALFLTLFSSAAITVGLISEDSLTVGLTLGPGILLGLFDLFLLTFIGRELRTRSARLQTAAEA